MKMKPSAYVNSVLDGLRRNLRLAYRSLRRRPGFTFIVVLSLALGIGANTAIFSIVDATLLRPLPVPDPDRLVRIDVPASRLTQFGNASYLDWEDFRSRSRSFENLAITHGIAVGMTSGKGEPQVVYGDLVSSNFFATMQVQPVKGRDFGSYGDEAPGKSPVVIISYALWSRAFANDASIIGREVRLNGRPFTVIGVAPRSFTGPNLYSRPDIYVPVTMAEGITANGNGTFIHRDWREFNLFGRLKPGVTIAQVQAEMDVIMRNLEKAYPATNRDTIAIVRTEMNRRFAQGYLFPAVITTLVLCVLLIACANVASLLMARATSRMKEISTQFAVGATRGILVRQLLTESAVLAALGGTCGIALGQLCIRGYAAILPNPVAPSRPDLHLDSRVLTFAILASLIAVFLCGLAPAFSTAREAIMRASGNLRAGSTEGRSYGLLARRSLVVAQVALSTVLLIGGGLLLKAFLRAQRVDLGFNPNHVLLVTTDPRMQGYSNAKAREFQQQFMREVSNVPGVEGVSVASYVPFDSGASWDLAIDGYTAPGGEKFVDTDTNQVGPDYFKTMQIPVLRGREFTERDNASTPLVAIVNETLARRYIVGRGDLEKAIGHHIALRDHPDIAIVGVVRDSNYGNIAAPPGPVFYLPYAQVGPPIATLYLRTKGDSQAVTAQMRAVLKGLDPEIAPLSVIPLATLISMQGLFQPRMSALFGATFGTIALVLAVVGLYGVVSFLVGRRTREIGIRMAFGAPRSAIVRMVLRNGLGLALGGLVIGAISALLLTPLISDLLIGVRPHDAEVFAGVALLLSVVTVAASWVPARDAAKVDPMVALRYE